MDNLSAVDIEQFHSLLARRTTRLFFLYFPHILSISMAHPLTNLGDHSTDYLTTNQPNPPPADDFKSYDDLIDQYAEPYSRISRHQTFKVQTSPIDHSESRGPSYSLDFKSPYLGGKAHDEAEEDPPEPSYPPKIKREKLVDQRKWWQQVTAPSLLFHKASSYLLQDSP